MKKVIKLSVIAVFAMVAYTNASLISEELNLGDVTLSSVIQNAHALTEATGPNCRYEDEINNTRTYRETVGDTTCYDVEILTKDCWGNGSHCCLRGQTTFHIPC